MGIEIRELTPALWPEFERLFGKNGACGGCWCMAWRLKDGQKWDDLKGAKAKRCQKKLIGDGKSHGMLAFIDGDPVGWCAYGRRLEFPRIGRARTLRCDDAERVWSLPCFFIKRGFRDQGVATALLAATLQALRKRGATIAEGYPVRLRRGQRLPDAFAWTGTLGLFARFGFTIAGDPGSSKVRVRKRLGARS
jgi:GNAT superfamily N-acetyltransferase